MSSRIDHRAVSRLGLALALILAGCSSGNDTRSPVVLAKAAPQKSESERLDKQNQMKSVMVDFHKAIQPMTRALRELSRRVEAQGTADGQPVRRLPDGVRLVDRAIETVYGGTLKFNPDGSWSIRDNLKGEGNLKPGACDASSAELDGKRGNDGDQLTLNLLECGTADPVTLAEITVQGAKALASLHLENIKELALSVGGRSCAIQFSRDESSVDCEPMELKLGLDKISVYRMSLSASARGSGGKVGARIMDANLHEQANFAFRFSSASQATEKSDDKAEDVQPEELE